MHTPIRFTVFADLHYKKNMYAATIMGTLNPILERAGLNDSEFLLHCGDLCNDYKGSPELIYSLFNNIQDLPFYGVFGNHELESAGNTLEFVTPRLHNRPVKGENYYYFDIRSYRFVCLDTNYSLLDGKWVHNTEASWGAPKGAKYENSLSPAQLAWLEDVLTDAERLGMRVVVVSHAEFSGYNSPSPDAEAVRGLFAKVNKNRKTVILAINGHYHTDHLFERDGVYYFDCNTVQNGYWLPQTEHHYKPGQTYTFEDYQDGRFTNTEQLDLLTLSQAKNTWFFTKPLSAVITISGDSITIDGSETEWMYDLHPDEMVDGAKPTIESRKLTIKE